MIVQLCSINFQLFLNYFELFLFKIEYSEDNVTAYDESRTTGRVIVTEIIITVIEKF